MSEGRFALGGLAALAIWILVALPLLHQGTDAITIFNGLLVLVTVGLVCVGLHQAGLPRAWAKPSTIDPRPGFSFGLRLRSGFGAGGGLIRPRGVFWCYIFSAHCLIRARGGPGQGGGGWPPQAIHH